MGYSRKPKHPHGTHCNLHVTLDAISMLADDQIAQWGRSFDWSQPVERLTVARKPGGVPTLEIVPAVEILIDRQDPRLNELLLRQDMFNLVDFSRAHSYSQLLTEQSGSQFGHFGSQSGLLVSAFDRALLWSDIQTASTLQGWLDQPSHHNSLLWHLVQMTTAKTPGGLLLNRQPKPAIEQALDYCEQLVSRTAKEFFTRGFRGGGLPAYEKKHLRAWRHGMCVQALRFGSRPLWETLLDRLECKPTRPMFSAALAALDFDALASLAKMGRDNAVGEAPSWPSPNIRTLDQPSLLPASPNLPEASTLSEEAVQCVMMSSLPDKEKLRVAARALSGTFMVSNPLSHLPQFIPTHLASLSSQWSPSVLEGVQALCPIPSGEEMFILLGCASNEVWNARLQSWLSQPRQARAASLEVFLGQSSFDKINDTSKVWIARLGQWMSNLDEDVSSALMDKYLPEALKSQACANEQHYRLVSSTVSAPSPAKQRRM